VLIKNYMSRDDQAVCAEIKTAIAFVIRVAMEDTPGGPRGKFVGRGGDSVRVTHTAEDAQMLVRRSRAEEGELWAYSMYHLRRKAVQ
jgi:hypothetical protein